MNIETKRLLLRPYLETDAAELFEYASDPEIGPRAGWPVHKDETDSLQIIRNVLSAPETYAVINRETGCFMGSIGLKKPEQRLNDLPESAIQMEIGYWIGRPFWGNGFIPEAVNALLRHGFENLDCAAIWCGHYADNDQSRRVIEKCGFIWQLSCATTNLLGDTHETAFYVLRKEEWATRPAKEQS